MTEDEKVRRHSIPKRIKWGILLLLEDENKDEVALTASATRDGHRKQVMVMQWLAVAVHQRVVPSES